MALWRPFAEHENEPIDLSRNAPAEEVPPRAIYSGLVLPVAPAYYVPYPYAPVYHQPPYHTIYSPGIPPALATSNSPDTTQASLPSTSASGLQDGDDESLSGDLEYQAFEEAALQGLAEKNGGTFLKNNPRMRRSVQSQMDVRSDSYRKQRERNNHAAKQSRDRRKMREMRLAFQVSFLTKKVADMKARIAAGVCGRCEK